MPIDFEFHSGFDAGKYAEQLQKRGWQTELIRVGNMDMHQVRRGDPVLCGDGRVQERGAKLIGGINFVAAAKTGGSDVGFREAARMISEEGLVAGSHSDCGFHREWVDGRLVTTLHPRVRPEIDLGRWVQKFMEMHQGLHIKTRGAHQEKRWVVNSASGISPVPDLEQFIHDQGLAKRLGIDPMRSLTLAAETIERLSSVRQAVILVP